MVNPIIPSFGNLRCDSASTARLPYPVHGGGGKRIALPIARRRRRLQWLRPQGVRMRKLLLIPIVVFIVLAPPLSAADITPAGKKLADFLDAFDVEHLWDGGKSVAWKTGKPLDKQ